MVQRRALKVLLMIKLQFQLQIILEQDLSFSEKDLGLLLLSQGGVLKVVPQNLEISSTFCCINIQLKSRIKFR
uniref:Putative ovule protein n=1 Tax=Solanum chacoense TaxID=4108 RepID=A0A0V0GVW4_SOLCH